MKIRAMLTRAVEKFPAMKIRIDRWPWVWAVLTVLLVGAIVTLSVALHASDQSASADRASARAAHRATLAAQRAAQTAECVNSVLAERAVLAQADHDNENAKITGQRAAVKDQERGLAELVGAKGNQPRAMAGFDLYQQGVAEFQKALDDWTVRDNAITKQKQLHPLGRC